MKFLSLCCALSIAAATNAYAFGPGDFEDYLDRAETFYPVLKAVRKHQPFKRFTEQALKISETSQETLQHVLKVYVPLLIRNGDKTVFRVVELLDPVYRDVFGMKENTPMLPVIEGSKSLYTVHRVLGSTNEDLE